MKRGYIRQVKSLQGFEKGLPEGLDDRIVITVSRLNNKYFVYFSRKDFQCNCPVFVPRVDIRSRKHILTYSDNII